MQACINMIACFDSKKKRKKPMAIIEYVSEEERREIIEKVNDALLRNASDEEIDKIRAKLPLLPCLALSLKETRGLQGLLDSDFNLYDAVQEYGEDFLKP